TVRGRLDHMSHAVVTDRSGQQRPPARAPGRAVVVSKRLVAVGVLVVCAAVGAAWAAGAFDGRRASSAAVSSKPRSAVRSDPGEERRLPARQQLFTQGPINTTFAGLTTFRGNATRDYYGEGPLPAHPKILWAYPRSGGLCSRSSDLFGTETWCGT